MTAGDVTGSHILSIATEKFSLEAAAREMLQKYKKKSMSTSDHMKTAKVKILKGQSRQDEKTESAMQNTEFVNWQNWCDTCKGDREGTDSLQRAGSA